MSSVDDTFELHLVIAILLFSKSSVVIQQRRPLTEPHIRVLTSRRMQRNLGALHFVMDSVGAKPLNAHHQQPLLLGKLITYSKKQCADALTSCVSMDFFHFKIYLMLFPPA